MLVQLSHVGAPVAAVGFPEVVQAVEHGQVHVRPHPVDQGNPAGGQIEDNPVLVFHPVGPKQASAVLSDPKPPFVPPEAVRTDPPRPPLGRRQPGVGQHQLPRYPLHPGVLVADGSTGARRDQHIGEAVVDPVSRGEHDNIGDVVQEPVDQAWLDEPFRVHPVAVTDGPGKHVEKAVVVDEPGIEHRPVARGGGRAGHGTVVYATNRAPSGGRGRPHAGPLCG